MWVGVGGVLVFICITYLKDKHGRLSVGRIELYGMRISVRQCCKRIGCQYF